MIILRSLVILDLIFMVQAARKRLYLELRGECAEPDEANRSLLGVVGFWANLSPLLWLAAASVGYVAKSVAGALSMRLVGNEELRTHLLTPRPVAEQADESLL